MFYKKILALLKRHGILKSDNDLEKKKKLVKEKIDKLGITWKDVENVIFWDTPVLSFSFYLVFMGIFWKLISYELQRIGLTIVLISGLVVVSEIRKIIKDHLLQRSYIVIIPEKKRLGFDMNDVIHVSAEVWLATESHAMYLNELKEKKDPILCFYLAAYIGGMAITFAYIPVAEILFIFGTFLYFYPVCSYLGIIEKTFERFERMFRPIAMHWAHNQTKRTRNRNFSDIVPSKTQLSDKENEDFIPEEQTSRDKNVMYDSSQDSMDEFDLRGKLHMREDHSSDYDEDSFLPHGTSDLPSMSQFDSMMEPLNDEFHQGLDFQNMTSKSSYFGIPEIYQHDQENRKIGHDDTDDDIDDLPIEETDGSTRYANIVSYDSGIGKSGEIKESGGFEFVDKTELQDITDEELYVQSNEQAKKRGGIVSNMLGY